LADSESALVKELRALAGVTDGDRFEVRREGLVVSVEYVGGSSSRLTLSVMYDTVARALAGGGYRGGTELAAIRPMLIALRPERDTERAGKESGMDIEVQTGDPTFDAAVYVDTSTPHDVTIQVLSPDVRRGVLELFALEFTNMVIDGANGNVAATTVTFASLVPAEEPGRRAIEAFVRIAQALPRVKKLAGEHAPHPLDRTSTLLGVAGVVMLAHHRLPPLLHDEQSVRR
jgi:hypothetical protein